MGFALTEVAVGVNAKKIQAYVEKDTRGNYRLFAAGAQNKLWITNATHGGLVAVVARIEKGGHDIGLFILELPEEDVCDERSDYEFRCESSSVAAFAPNHNSRLHFRNFPIPRANRVPADGVEVLFYCLRMGRCMLAAMTAGYQRMLARDASAYALRRQGVGGPIIRHELPRLALGSMLGGALMTRALAFLSLKQDEDGVDLAGLRDLTKSASAQAGLESMIACEHVLGGRSFDRNSRVNAARDNLHLFGVVEGEDNMIRMGMVRDVTARFVDSYLAGMLSVLARLNEVKGSGGGRHAEPVLRLGLREWVQRPGDCARAILGVFSQRESWMLLAWAIRNAALDLVNVPLRLVPASLLPRYRRLPKKLAIHARFAERELRRLRWTYLRLSVVLQLELTRAQIILMRFGLCIEHLTSMLVICCHAALQDESQHAVADLQARLIRRKFEA